MWPIMATIVKARLPENLYKRLENVVERFNRKNPDLPQMTVSFAIRAAITLWVARIEGKEAEEYELGN